MTIVTWVFILAFAACAVQSTRLAYMHKQADLYWLAGNFAAATVGNVFTLLVPVPVLGTLGLIVSSLCMVMFVHRTFYRDQKSPYLFIIALLVVLGIYQIYSAITNPTAFVSMTQLGFEVLWGWQVYLAFRMVRHLAKDRTVEDWVKSRYWLWLSYTLVMFIISGRMLLPIPYASFEFIVNTPLTILAVLVQFVTWAMPEPVRRFLNRNYKPVVAVSPSELMQMSEEELLQQVRP